MKRFFSLAITLMNQLTYPQKFVILLLIYLPAAGVMFFSLNSNFSETIQTTQLELQGVSVIKPLTQTMQHIHQHLSTTTLVHDDFMQQEEIRIEKDLAGKVALIENHLPTDSLLNQGGMQINKEWRNLKSHWYGLSTKTDKWSVNQNFAAHVQLLDKSQQFKENVADYYNLSFETDKTTHYLTDIIINKLPDVVEKLEQLQALSAGALIAQQLTTTQENDILVSMAKLTQSVKSLDLNFDKIGQINTLPQTMMSSIAKDILKCTIQISNVVQSDILSKKFQLSPNDFYALNTQVINKIYAKNYETLLPTLESLLEKRIADTQKWRFLTIGIACVLFFIAQYFFIGIYFATMESIRSLVKSAQRFADGDLSERITLKTEDELRLVAENFNKMAARFQYLLAISEENQQQLNKSEQNLRTLIKTIPDLIWLKDKEGVYITCNTTFEAYMGLGENDIIGKTDYDFFDHSLADIFSMHDKSIMQSGKVSITENSVSFKSDHHHGYLETIKTPLRDLDGNIVGVLGIARDISRRKKNENELRKFSLAVEQNPCAIMITDLEANIEYANAAYIGNSGYTKDEIIGKKSTILKSGKNEPDTIKNLWDTILKGGTWKGELINRRKDGSEYIDLTLISPVRQPNGEISHYLAIKEDITERKIIEEENRNLAFSDPLTGLSNRRKLLERLKHTLARCQRENTQIAVLMLDLDRFKAVNDTLGHLAGDELLKQVSQRITDRLRTTDMVARMGGDEFVVLLEDITHEEDAARIATEIVIDLTLPFQLGKNHDVRIGASIGIALYPQHGNTSAALMDNADIALYQAKDNGRGCFAYFSESLTLAARERLDLESRLRRGIDQGELRVFYQAQVDMISGEIIGAEALVRWQEPNEGLIPPYKFIRIAEETGLIMRIGEWVLREVCRQGKEWLDAGFAPIRLAVNVSPAQFKHCDMLALITSVLNETKYPAEQLEIELTESGLMEHQEVVIDILGKLRDLGIHLAIDDFGTGYSSLAYLKRFPMNVLKIDKSFIDDIPYSADDMAITSAIISMGQTLGFKVLAEGVETPEQLAFLSQKGCDIYQGYITSKPIPADKFLQFRLNARKKHSG
ncbi:MAG: EAL domain-containing protein [Methylococcaceae bacterium]